MRLKKSLLLSFILSTFGSASCRKMSESKSKSDANESNLPEAKPGPGQTILEQFLSIMSQRFPEPKKGVQRPVFVKPHGCAEGVFEVSDKIGKQKRIGVFAGTQYPAIVRFSSDTIPNVSDLENNTLGMGIKIFNVAGQKILEGNETANTHDFVMQNHNVFFVNNAEEFRNFTRAALEGKFDDYIKVHPGTGTILKAMAKKEQSILGAQFSSTTTYKFADTIVKYKMEACQKSEISNVVPTDKNYLKTDLVKTIKEKGACLVFSVQFYQNDTDTPRDTPMVEWKAPFEEFAKLTIPAQDITTNLNKKCENLSMNPWHALAEHAPFGSINEARKIVYTGSAKYRRTRNEIPVEEPSKIEK